MRDKVMGPDQTAKFGPVRNTGGAPMAWRNLAKYGGSVTYFFLFLFLGIAAWPNPWTDFDALTLKRLEMIHRCAFWGLQ